MAESSPLRAAIMARQNSRLNNSPLTTSSDSHYGIIPPMRDAESAGRSTPPVPLPSMNISSIHQEPPIAATSSRSGSFLNTMGSAQGPGEVMGGIDPRMTITILQAEVSRLKEENQRVNTAYQDALLSVGSVRLANHKREEENITQVRDALQSEIDLKTEENRRLQTENEKLSAELANSEKRVAQMQDRAQLAENLLKEEMEESLKELKKRNSECNDLQTKVSQLQQELAIAQETSAKATRAATESAREAALAREKYRQLKAQMASSGVPASKSGPLIQTTNRSSIDTNSPPASPYSTMRNSPLSIGSTAQSSAHSPETDMRISGMIASAMTATVNAIGPIPPLPLHNSSSNGGSAISNSTLGGSMSALSTREDSRIETASSARGGNHSAPASQMNSRIQPRKVTHSDAPSPSKQFMSSSDKQLRK